jgi:hypothetical protein
MKSMARETMAAQYRVRESVHRDLDFELIMG